MIQAPLAVVLATIGMLRASHGSDEFVLVGLLLLLAALCYWGSLSRFADAAHARNRRVYATWAAGLLIAVTTLFLPARTGVPSLCLAAILAVFAFRSTGKLSLGMHASSYLAAAAALSSLLTYAGNALAGPVQTTSGWSVWVVALSAIIVEIISLRWYAASY